MLRTVIKNRVVLFGLIAVAAILFGLLFHARRQEYDAVREVQKFKKANPSLDKVVEWAVQNFGALNPENVCNNEGLLLTFEDNWRPLLTIPELVKLEIVDFKSRKFTSLYRSPKLSKWSFWKYVEPNFPDCSVNVGRVLMSGDSDFKQAKQLIWWEKSHGQLYMVAAIILAEDTTKGFEGIASPGSPLQSTIER